MQFATMQRPAGLLLASLIGAALCSGAAHAESLSSAKSAVEAQAGTGSAQSEIDYKQQAGLGSVSASKDPVSASASADGSLGYNALSGVASASAGSTSTVANQGHRGQGNATTNLSAIDTLTVTSSTLNFGDAVTLNFVINLDSTVAASGQFVPVSSVLANLYLWDAGFGGQMAYDHYITQGSLSNFTSTYGDTSTNGLNTFSFSYNTTVGASFDVEFNLILNANAQFFATGNGPITSDSSAMGNAWFTVTGNGINLASLSGTDYSSLPPVPEPGTYAMMLAGLGLVGWSARRRLSTARV